MIDFFHDIFSAMKRYGSKLAIFALFFTSSCWFGLGVAQAQTSDAYLVIDSRTGKVLVGEDIDKKLQIASITKVATACVVLDWLTATKGDRNAYMTVPASVSTLGGANPLNLQAGDRLTIRDGLFSALMASDNAAALTLAEHIGNEMWSRTGSRARSGLDFFVEQMNELAKAKGMTRTKFVNPHGLDHERTRGYSSAADIARISLYALEKPSFNFFVAQTERDISYLRGQQKLSFRIGNTNKLLGQLGVEGVKTGRTTRAGDCLVLSARKDDKIVELADNRRIRTPYHIIVVTLNSEDRFGQGASLIHQGWAAYEQWLNDGLPLSGRGEDVVKLPTD
ncbi:MAG: D-alanyl-D-alanine carboxypeptidase (penicillin-binding protein 5/6) [Verrucomicrobiales bacterium]